MNFPSALTDRIKSRPDLWREVCILSLELLAGTDEHIDKVLTLFRTNGTEEQFNNAANAAYAANAAAHAAAHAAASSTQRFYADLYLLLEFAPVKVINK